MVYNGTGWVVLSTGRANPVGLDLIKTHTIGSAVSAVEVTDVFSGAYDNYKIIVSGGTATASNSDGSLKFGSSATGYNWQLIYGTYSTTIGGNGGTNGTSALYAFWSDGSNGTYANIEVQSPFLAKYTSFQAQMSRGSIGGTTIGVHQVATSYTSFTLTSGSGTMTGGTIAVYGYAK
jgi:hypothetical protein